MSYFVMEEIRRGKYFKLTIRDKGSNRNMQTTVMVSFIICVFTIHYLGVQIK